MSTQAFDLAVAKVFGKDWKSTFAGYLNIFIPVGVYVTGYIVQLKNPHPWVLSISGALTFLVGLARVVLGHMTIDAGSTPAIVPGEGIQVVASHEMPDNPTNTAVKESQ